MHAHRRSWMAAVLSTVLAAALLALAIAKIDIAAAGHVLASLTVGWIALALGLMVSSFVARAESWFVALRAAAPAAELGRGAVRRGLLIGMAASTVAPGRVGEAVRTWIIARRLGGTRDSVAIVLGTVLSQTLINLVALSILAVVALSSASFALGPIGGFAPALVVPVIAVTLVVAGPRLLRLAANSSVRALRRSAAWLSGQLVQIRRGLRAFGDARTAAHTASIQLGGWALQLATCSAVMLAAHLTPHPMLAAAAAVLLAVNVAAIVPVTPSNVGLFQAACIAALAPFGVPASEGLAYGIALQSVEIVSALALGVPALLSEGLSWSELRERASTEPQPPRRSGPPP